MSSEPLSISDQLLAAISSDFAPVVTIRSRCTAKFDDLEAFREVMTDLIQRELVETGLWGWRASSGSRCSYRLTEAGMRRKARIVPPAIRNQELFTHA